MAPSNTLNKSISIANYFLEKRESQFQLIWLCLTNNYNFCISTIFNSLKTIEWRLNINFNNGISSELTQSVKQRGKFASFTIKERQSLSDVNSYLIVFNAYFFS